MGRNIIIDIAKGIGILLVYIGHCNLDSNSVIFHWIYSFHMPLFFTLSGLTFTPPKFAVKNLYNKYSVLLSIYILFSIVNIFILGIILDETRYDVIHVVVLGWGRNPLWFIPILLFIEVLMTMVVSGTKAYKIIAVGALLTLFVFKITTNRWLPYCISETPWFFLWFSFGYCLRNYLLGLLEKPRPLILLVLTITHILILFLIIIPFNPGYRNADNDFISYILRSIVAVIGIVEILMAAKILASWSFKSSLSWLGANTIVLYALHWPLIKWMSTKTDMSAIYLALPFVISLSLIPLYNKYVLPLIKSLRLRGQTTSVKI